MKARLSYECAEIEREFGEFSNGCKGFYLHYHYLNSCLEFDLPGSLENMKRGLECSDWVDVSPDEIEFFKKLEGFDDDYGSLNFDYPRYWDDLSSPDTAACGCSCYLEDGTRYDKESSELEFENDGCYEVIMTYAVEKPDLFEIVYDDETEESFTDKDLFLKKVEALCKKLESKK
jgi:hypothetical protein